MCKTDPEYFLKTYLYRKTKFFPVTMRKKVEIFFKKCLHFLPEE